MRIEDINNELKEFEYVHITPFLEKYKTKSLDIKNIGKLYYAWSNSPYITKRGKHVTIIRFLDEYKKESFKNIELFYKDIIAKSILWESFNTVHGVGKNSISNAKNSVVPYSLGAIFSFTDGCKNNKKINLDKIFKDQNISDNFKIWAKKLMILVHNLIEIHSEKLNLGADISLNTRKKELWISIIKSIELKDFFKESNTKISLNEYLISNKTII